MVSRRSRLRLLRFRCAPPGDTVCRSEVTAAGRSRTLGLLLERTEPEGPGECPVLCRSQFAAVGVLAGGAGRRGNDAGDGYSVFAGRLPVNAGGFFCGSNLESTLLKSL